MRLLIEMSSDLSATSHVMRDVVDYVDFCFGDPPVLFDGDVRGAGRLGRGRREAEGEERSPSAASSGVDA